VLVALVLVVPVDRVGLRSGGASQRFVPLISLTTCPFPRRYWTRGPWGRVAVGVVGALRVSGTRACSALAALRQPVAPVSLVRPLWSRSRGHSPARHRRWKARMASAKPAGSSCGT